jgi:hypothetical protein
MAVADGSVSEYDIQSAGRHIEKAAGECLDMPLRAGKENFKMSSACGS